MPVVIDDQKAFLMAHFPRPKAVKRNVFFHLSAFFARLQRAGEAGRRARAGARLEPGKNCREGRAGPPVAARKLLIFKHFPPWPAICSETGIKTSTNARIKEPKWPSKPPPYPAGP
ncbi:MAG: hypothetical protein V3V17_05005 [Alphaproteobacteria bacterium]